VFVNPEGFKTDVQRADRLGGMKTCSYCNSTILFSGVTDSGFTFCNQKCRQNGSVLIAAQSIPPEVVEEHVNKVHSGPCPKCQQQAGPVDAHTSHFVWSALLVTSWSSKPAICCRSCATKKQILSTVGSALFGWWGFPWGLIVTPVQIGRNIVAMCKGADRRPSEQLRKLISLNIASHVLAEQQNSAPALSGH
jgi:hypothetical protein